MKILLRIVEQLALWYVLLVGVPLFLWLAQWLITHPNSN